MARLPAVGSNVATASVHLRPVDHPSAWKASDFRSLADLTVRLEKRHIAAFDRAYAEIERRGLGLDDIEHRHFAVPEIAGDLRVIYHEVMRGRGLVMVDRLPVADWPLRKTEIVYWGIGTHFGRGNSQSVLGDRLGHVTNVGGKDPNERAYRNSLPLPLHTDACDILCMLSIRKGAEGGESQYASALSVHNEMLAERPDLLEPLYTGFHYHRFGEHGPGEAAVTEHRVPVLSAVDGHVSCRFVPEYIQMGARELGQPLTARQQEALAYFELVARRPENMLEFTMDPGLMLFCNNHTTLHGRSGFEDVPGTETSRLLLRMWITAHEEDRRPIDPAIELYRAKGIEKREGRTDTYYRGKATDVLPSARTPVSR